MEWPLGEWSRRTPARARARWRGRPPDRPRCAPPARRSAAAPVARSRAARTARTGDPRAARRARGRAPPAACRPRASQHRSRACAGPPRTRPESDRDRAARARAGAVAAGLVTMSSRPPRAASAYAIPRCRPAGCDRRRRARSSPERVDQPVVRDELVRVEQEHREQRPLLGRANTENVAVHRDLERREQPTMDDARSAPSPRGAC